VLSGVLLAHFWWGSVFLVNLPAMALLLVAGPALLPRGERRPGSRFDLVSSALSLAAVLLAVYGVKEWALNGVSPVRVGCLVVGLALGLVFVRRQLTGANPLVDPALLRNRAYRAALAGNSICAFALVGNAVFMTGYLQLVLGYSPLSAALWSLVPTLGVGAAAPFASPLSERCGSDRVLAGGLAVGAIGFAVLVAIGTHSLLLTLIGGGVLAAGLVVAMTICGEQVLGALDPGQAGAGAAVSEAASELGGALGIAVLGSIGAAGYQASVHVPDGVHGSEAGDSLAGAAAVAAHLPGGLANQLMDAARTAYVHGLHLAALTGALALAVSAISLLVRRSRGAAHARAERETAVAESSRV
jgi:DHA2 family multidrug resistance protein-like MFS transporter